MTNSELKTLKEKARMKDQEKFEKYCDKIDLICNPNKKGDAEQ